MGGPVASPGSTYGRLGALVRPRTAPARLVTVVLLAATGLVMLVYVGVLAVSKVATVDAVIALTDIDGEGNIPTWWNTALLVLVSAEAWLLAALAPRGRRRWGWAVIALAVLYLSMDEAARLHENLETVALEAGVRVSTYAWLVPGVVMAAAGMAVLIWAGRSLPVESARRLLAALLVYAFGALVVEFGNGMLAADGVFGVSYRLGTMVEESLEMGACVLAVGALLDHLLDVVPQAVASRRS